MGFLGFLICAMQGLFKRLLYKYYPNVKKKQAKRLDIRLSFIWIKAVGLAFNPGFHLMVPP